MKCLRCKVEMAEIECREVELLGRVVILKRWRCPKCGRLDASEQRVSGEAK
jgi:hypothetical protein